MTRRAAIYTRQSLDRSGEGLAVRRQLEDCRALVKRNGWRTVAVFSDNDVSASSGRERPEYRKMIDAVKAGRIDTIVSWAPDRLARRPRDLEDILDLSEGRGITLATVSGDVDLSTPYGRAIARIFGAIARQEGEQKGARQVRANQQRAQSGKTNWSRRPFGYDRDAQGAAVVVDDEADVIRWAAEEILNGATLASAVRELHAGGWTTSTGKPFTVTALRRVLLNPRHAGHATHRGRVVGEGDWEPILEADVQDRLSAHLRDPARRTQTSTNRRYLMSGLLVCGVCGATMFASPMGQKGAYWMAYRCRTSHLSRRLDLVDEFVTAVVVGRLSRPDASSLLTRGNEDGEALRERSVKLRQQLDDLAGLLAEGVLTAAGVRKVSTRLRAELEDVDRERATLHSADAIGELVTADDVERCWDGLTLDAQRSAVELLLTATILPAGKGIRFDADQVRIEWRTT
jgi:site-specific DNA recombinase